MKKYIILPLTALCICLALFAYKQSQKDYIDGNILNLAFTIDVEANKTAVFPKWLSTGFMQHLLYRTAFLASPDLSELKPNLAESYEILDDGYTYKIVFKDNQKWSDGSPITVEDLATSLEYVRETKSTNERYSDAFSKIQSTEIDGNTITLRLTERHRDFIDTIALFPILPKKSLIGSDFANFKTSDYWKNPIVSGMYYLEEIVEDSHYKFSHNPHYGGVKPKIDTVLLHYDDDQMFDFYLADDVLRIINFRSMRGYQEYPVPIDIYRYFTFNVGGIDGNINEAMQDINIRRAISHAIDSKSILHSVYLNMGAVETTVYHYTYDQQLSLDLIKRSNYDLARPLRFAYYYKDLTSFYSLQEMVKNLEAVGFTVELVKGDSLDELLKRRDFDFLIKDMITIKPTDRFVEYSKNHPLTQRLFAGSPEFTSLMAQLFSTYDNAELAELANELNKLGGEAIYRFPLFNFNQAVYMSDRVYIPKNAKFGNPMYILDMDYENWEIKKR